MKIARPVVNAAGMVLFGEGMELTEGILEKLASLNIESIYVEGAGEPRLSRDEYLRTMEVAFSKAGDDELTTALRRVLQEHINSLYGEG